MNKQDIFNKAYLGLEAQGFQRAQENGIGRYKTSDGLRCAIGWVTEGMEDFGCKSVSFNPVVKYLTPRLNIESEKDVYFLQHLQAAHDRSGDLKANLIKFAEDHNLTVPTEPVEDPLPIEELAEV